jgi:hypothetical protein
VYSRNSGYSATEGLTELPVRSVNQAFKESIQRVTSQYVGEPTIAFDVTCQAFLSKCLDHGWPRLHAMEAVLQVIRRFDTD